MMTRTTAVLKRFAIAGFFLVMFTAAAAAWVWFPWVFSPSYTIRIATGPLGSDGHKFISAFRRELLEEHPRFRLLLEEKFSLEGSAAALQSGQFDLAIARSDHPAVANGGTIVVINRIPLVIMASTNSSVASMKDLVGKKIALLYGTEEKDPLLKTVIDFYGLKPGNMLRMSSAEVGTALRSKQVAAVVAMGVVGPGAIAEAVKAIVNATKKQPKFINLEAKAIIEQNPVYEEVEIPQGAFVAAPASPVEEVATVAVTVRLVARKTMPKDVASEITRLLLVTRAKLAATLPRMGQIEAPDTGKKGVLPVHPGAAAYLDGSQVSFFEEAMNMLFNISIIGGVAGSVVLWFRASWRRHRPDETQRNLACMPAMLREAKTAPLDQLDVIEEELDAVAGWLLDQFVREQIAPDHFNGVSVMISQIRSLIERRRKA
ncbi:TAXI family TRAP transporter solute-binding subunit [Propionivibrio sp.]|uniref:TAXI family TRAP transporter solute-binding subunit n=1 Tax=Propionivibrio sp. TaxID=2212460 RepID=UPI00260238DC|nr:TAXI family TRAP transporter solute-binding subunit [Propionivibrio sp.]